jgi:hypothetical protein
MTELEAGNANSSKKVIALRTNYFLVVGKVQLTVIGFAAGVYVADEFGKDKCPNRWWFYSIGWV